MNKPPFDPAQHYDDGGEVKPPFDPNQPADPVDAPAQASAKPAFDPSQPADPVETTDYGTLGQFAKMVPEQFISGATLGGSKVAETKSGLVAPEDIKGRENAFPISSSIVSGLGTIAGAVGVGAATGGAGLLPEGASLAAKVGAGSIVGGLIAGTSQVNDDWSQNKAADGQRIAASTGIGMGIGGLATLLPEAILQKFSPIAKVAPGVAAEAESAALKDPSLPPPPGGGPPPPPSELPGGVASGKTKPAESIEDALDRITAAQKAGMTMARPQSIALHNALKDIDLGDFNPPQMQLDAIADPNPVNGWTVAREVEGPEGDAVRGLESGQVQTAGKLLDSEISSLHPSESPIDDSVAGGNRTNQILTERSNQVEAQAKPQFQALRDAGLADMHHEQGVIAALSEGDNNPVASMFDGDGKIKPYDSRMPLDEGTYNAVKSVVDPLGQRPVSIQELMTLRNKMGSSISRDTSGGQNALNEIGQLKAKLMTYIEDHIQGVAQNRPDLQLREPLQSWAINQAYRGEFEKMGASVGRQEMGVRSNIVPEDINKNIFQDTSSVQMTKNFLNNEKAWNEIVANHLAQQRASFAKDGAEGANKFGNFLNNKAPELNEAFADNPGALQRIKNLNTAQRLLPPPRANPSGTAPTIKKIFETMYPQDMAKNSLQYVFKKAEAIKSARAFNSALAKKAADLSASESLQNSAAKTSDGINRKVREIFRAGGKGSAENARKVNK